VKQRPDEKRRRRQTKRARRQIARTLFELPAEEIAQVEKFVTALRYPRPGVAVRVAVEFAA
jgi:hypothetical protein